MKYLMYLSLAVTLYASPQEVLQRSHHETHAVWMADTWDFYLPLLTEQDIYDVYTTLRDTE